MKALSSRAGLREFLQHTRPHTYEKKGCIKYNFFFSIAGITLDAYHRKWKFIVLFFSAFWIILAMSQDVAYQPCLVFKITSNSLPVAQWEKEKERKERIMRNIYLVISFGVTSSESARW